MKIKITVGILLLFIQCINSIGVMNFIEDLCKIKDIKGNAKEDIKYLMDVCLSDDTCSYLYHINPDYKNITVFSKLILPYYNQLGRNLDNSIYGLCISNTKEELKIDIHLLQMIKRGFENRLLCGQNQIVQINQDESMSCVCSAGSDCNTPTTDFTSFYYLLGTIIFGVTVLVII
jgi:hypothetical protein